MNTFCCVYFLFVVSKNPSTPNWNSDDAITWGSIGVLGSSFYTSVYYRLIPYCLYNFNLTVTSNCILLDWVLYQNIIINLILQSACAHMQKICNETHTITERLHQCHWQLYSYRLLSVSNIYTLRVRTVTKKKRHVRSPMFNST